MYIVRVLNNLHIILLTQVHKKTHEGERCFKCDLCPYSSISQRHLESHMLIHTGNDICFANSSVQIFL